jgi:3-oxoacyl-[acyl-carrier protein] reductase
MRKRILVSGGSRGIGRAIAMALATQGYEVCINYLRNHAAATETIGAIEAAGGSAYLMPFDVADREAAKAAIMHDMETRGPYWGVVCNAGIAADAPFPLLSGADWDRVLRTNLDAFYNLLQPVVLPMIRARQGGRIVTLASVSGLVGNRGQTNYAASKAGIIGATKALAQELAKR